MNILDAVQQTTRRAGGGHTRRRGTEAFEQATKDWRTAEQPERVLRRMEQLGLQQEALTLSRSMSSGNGLVDFNPLERIIGQNQLMSSFFLPLGAERARAVGRIVTQTGLGVGTGFLISPRLLMTNNHVIKNDKIAAVCRIEFDYVRRFDGRFGNTQFFRLLPEEFFLTSVTRDDLNLDYTIVAVEPVNSLGGELAGRGSIPLVSTFGDLTVLEWANIIQHPGGDPQQVALRDNKVVKSLEHFIHYEADTQPGSSGSPVFNDQWQLVALHHSGVPDEERPGVYRLQNGDEWDRRRPLPYEEQLRMWAKVKWISNEGVRINSIIADAQSQLGGDAARQALFNEAVRENASPLLEGPGALCLGGIDRQAGAAASAGVVTQAASGVATWLIPLRVTVEINPDLSVKVLGGPASPAATSPSQHPVISGGAALPPLHVKVDAAAAVGRVRQMLEQCPDVLDVRDGFLWQDGFMTERQAVVVVLDPRVTPVSGDPYERLCIPRELEGLPIDITLGGPAALRFASRGKGLLAGEELPPAELFQERVQKIGYVKPEGLDLEEVREPMEVTCHVSPDDGWPVLNDFLGRVERSLTIGISHLCAPHVVSELKELARERPALRLNLVRQRGTVNWLVGPKEDDLGEAEVAEDLREIMGGRFRQAYVSVSGDTRTFANSYHINVAVRDGEELWLSSGNMQSLSQPPPEVRPAAMGEQSVRPLSRYNREWHVVAKNERLARIFESYLLHDLEAAEANPAAPLLPVNELFTHADRLVPDTDLFEESAQARYFARKIIERDESAPVTVRPLMTPDNYLEHVIRLVGSARNTLFIQNQSLSLFDPLSKNEDAFVELWREVRSRQEAGVDVRMIYRVDFDEDRARAVKDRLVKFGLNPECIRAQPRCHTKGVIVDSEAVLVGSHHWTNYGVTVNRDASLVFHHPEIARYYERIFLFDWEQLAREPQPAGPASISRGDSKPRMEFAQPGLTQPAGAVRVGQRDLLDD